MRVFTLELSIIVNACMLSHGRYRSNRVPLNFIVEHDQPVVIYLDHVHHSTDRGGSLFGASPKLTRLTERE